MAAVASPSLVTSIARPAGVRGRLRRPAIWVALSAWTLLVVLAKLEELDALGLDALRETAGVLQYVVPVAIGLVVLLARSDSSPEARLALGWTATVSGALVAIDVVGTNVIYALVPAALFCAAALALRWPVATLLATTLLAGFYNTFEVYTYLPPGQIIDGLLGGAWLALGYTWLTDRRRLPAGVNVALLLFGAYIAVTFLGALAAPDLTRSLYAFRSSAWLMTLVFLVPLWATTERRRRLFHQGAICIGLLVGAYAMLRWAIGPSGKEAGPARAGRLYVSTDLGELRTIGGFQSPQELGSWSGMMFAFALASALVPIGIHWRLLAAATAGLSGAALFAADVRFAMVAAVAGGCVVVALFAVGRSFSGRRALPLTVIVVLAAVGVGFFVTTKMSAVGSSGERFRNLVTDPINDRSVQDRLIKWRTLLADVDDKPFGLGLGASGAADVKYSRYTTDATFGPDSSFVKVIYDQGFLVLALFAAGLLVLAIALALGAVEARNPVVGGRALASCGVMVAFVVIMSGGIYFEGLVAAAGWLLVGIGCTRLVPQRA